MRGAWVALLLLCLLAACSTREKETAQSDTSKKLISVNDTVMKNKTYQADHSTSRHLVQLAKSVPNVQDATALVIGPYAVVGIDVKDRLERSRVEVIKYTVAETMKTDPRGAKAVVIADPDTVQRLRQMGTEIRHGRPVSGILNELAAIVGRVMPQLPNDILQNPDEKLPKQYDNQLDSDEKTQLRNEQEKQSNYHMNR
ncbi:YhcN/YlaJ family sporulation lipoprotein [Ectobacillus ponti]|uniref:YhcN/YlaJ family sporulation lipoprotein n=1 Tax=Ectobacillus ponti TaxID=2961894 RepID=A0AA41XDB2_9BACI|nr:YhcN/YlaJ family sporulation lipoprotein [Ectobacillus ponti]MCP8970785.1 YhcN/YlaJ family sporulation lipoprotein [Ectobacillus ponti]